MGSNNFYQKIFSDLISIPIKIILGTHMQESQLLGSKVVQRYVAEAQNTNKFAVSWNKTIDTENFIKEEFVNFTEKEKKEAVAVLGRFNEQLLVQYNYQSWIVLKNHHEIQQFMEIARKKYPNLEGFETIIDFLRRGANNLASQKEVGYCEDFIDFFEAYDQQHNKVKTMVMRKKAGGRGTDNCCTNYFLGWHKKKFIINYNGVMYGSYRGKFYSINKQGVVQDEQEDQITEYIGFDSGFRMTYGMNETGERLGILLSSSKRNLLVKADNIQDFVRFVYFVKFAQRYSSKVSVNRFNSFSPPRDGNDVNFFIDGADYFEHLAKAIESAKEQIYLTGWWVSPEFPLVRPYSSNLQYRLDNLLIGKSIQKVKIYIIVYFESSMLANDSEHTQKALQVNEYIKVIRHPSRLFPTLWTHHEKLVVIDQDRAFMGGLDICYGRWDTQKHDLTIRDPETYPGIQYNNSRTADIVNVQQIHKDSAKRTQPRLPWHDIAFTLRGPSVQDLCRHFIDYWNHANFENNYEEGYMLTMKTLNTQNQQEKMRIQHGEDRMEGFGIDLLAAFTRRNTTIGKIDRQQLAKHSENSIPMASNQRILNDIKEKQSQGSPGSQGRKSSEKVNATNIFSLLFGKKISQGNPKIEHENNAERPPSSSQMMKIQEERPVRQSQVSYYNEAMNKLGELAGNKQKALQLKKEMRLQYDVANSDTCQFLRSASSWSIGLHANERQKSIQNAYLQMIDQAKHYVYIQNQYFISGVKKLSTKNKIVERLIARIKQAHAQKRKFRVYIVMPLIPGYAGELYEDAGQMPRIIMYWQYLTIERHQNSLYKSLARENINPRDYIQFYGLRTHAILDDRPVTEIIYVHSKLMIVDDTMVICGSANINDRSMNGNRDSELAVIMNGGKRKEIFINGKPAQVSEKIHNLRRELFKEHFGFKDAQCADPLNEVMIQQIKARTKRNTEIYRDVFGCYPDDEMLKISQIKGKMRVPEIGAYKVLRGDIKGHAVELPLRFLQNEDIIQGKAKLIPDQLVT